MLVTFASVFLSLCSADFAFIDRNMRKTALRQSDSSSPETGYRRGDAGPNMRQKRGESPYKSLIKPTVFLTNRTSRSICPSEPAAVNKHYNVLYSFVVKGYLSQAVVGGLLSYLLT